MTEIEKYVAILGGSFDPPTIAHFQIASEVYNLVDNLDEVWLVPCGDKRSDKNLIANAFQRKEMLELGKKDLLDEKFSGVKICDIEVNNDEYLPTYDLLCILKIRYPTFKFYMSIGSDLIKGLSKWNNGEKLIRENNFIVICRESYEIDDNFLPNNTLVLQPNIYGSST